MAQAMMPLMIASTVMSFVGGMQESSAYEKMGKQQQAISELQAHNTEVVAARNAQIMQDQAKYEAARLTEQGGQEQATSQRAALEERRRKRLTLSRASAVAASQGGAVDPTTLNILSDIEGQGEYNALSALFEGDSAASVLRSQAALRTYEGDRSAEMTRYGGASEAQLTRYQGDVARYESSAKASQTRLKTVASAFSDGADLFQKYAPKKQQITWDTPRYR
jgi:hypothetical protein